MKVIVLLLFFISSEGCFTQEIYNLTVFFDTDTWELKREEQQKIADILKELNINNIYEIEIQGYCDDRADDFYNKELSLKRAEFVKNYFDVSIRNKHIEMSVDAKGEIPLNVDNEIADQRKQNRKVEISIKTLPNTNINKLTFAQIGDKIVLQNVLFESNRHAIIKESVATLDSLSNFFLENPNYHFNILGHICCRKKGSVDAVDDDTNKRGLSANRAKVIYDYFVRKGIDYKRMKFRGLKADFPLGLEDKYDRRVELEIVKK
jgi:outer membrane protein OmpA-like peptidoglycan-associated protein